MSTIGSIDRGHAPMDMAAMKKKMFEKMDTDGDGQLSKSELEEATQKAAEEHGGTASSIGGSMSIDDIFEKLDTNGDGALDTDEMDKMRQIMPKPPGGPPKGPPPGGMSGSPAEQIDMNDLSFNLQDLLSSEDDSLQMVHDRYLSTVTSLLSDKNESEAWEI